MARSTKKFTLSSIRKKLKPSTKETEPKAKKSGFQKILTAEGWRRRMMKKSGKK
jgi:hypothetical protein